MNIERPNSARPFLLAPKTQRRTTREARLLTPPHIDVQRGGQRYLDLERWAAKCSQCVYNNMGGIQGHGTSEIWQMEKDKSCTISHVDILKQNKCTMTFKVEKSTEINTGTT